MNKTLYKFIFKTLILLAPVLTFYLLVDYIIVNSNTAFNIKYKYIKNNKDIKCLFLGSSHTQNGVNPEFIKIKTANLAYSSQDVNIDYHLFEKYISNCENLKYVVLELDYHTLFRRHDNKFFRLPWYYYYHNININDQKLLYKFLLYPSNQKFFNIFLENKYIQKNNKEEYNKYGFIVNDFHDVFEQFNNDSLEILNSSKLRLINRHKEVSNESFKKNLFQIEQIIKSCNEKKVKVFLLKTPVYYTYINNYISFKNEERVKAIIELNKKYDVEVLDYEFFLKSTKYYKNDDHLNPLGAEKLSKELNKKLKG